MSQRVIADNWSLQLIAELYSDGLDADDCAQLPLSDDPTHAPAPIPCAVVALEALFDFLTDLILRDQILVDANFADAWATDQQAVRPLADQGIVVPYRFLDAEERLAEPRSAILERLLVSDRSRTQQEENAAAWAAGRIHELPHPFHSQLVWGGAGMLARSLVFETPYTPHPLRKRLFQNAGMLLPDADAVTRLTGVIREGRANVRRAHSSRDELCALQVAIDPLPIRVIREATSLANMLEVAAQMRDEYVGLRRWLGDYQASLSSDEFDDLSKQHALLRSVSDYVDGRIGRSSGNAPSFTIGVSAIDLGFSGRPVNWIRNKFGIRSMVNKLILDSSGRAEMKNLLGFFGHRTSALGLRVIEHFSRAVNVPA